MREKCMMCGAGDTSVSHPDYNDWVSEIFGHAHSMLYIAIHHR